jgi:23S rRNA (guanosine2251-2'-O)-methyltransferase
MPEKQENFGGLAPTCVVGKKPVLELLQSRPETVSSVRLRKGFRDKTLEEIIRLCKQRRVRFQLVPGQALDRIHKGHHQGVAAFVAALGFTDLPDLIAAAETAPLPLIVALDQVQDPANVGVLARTLYGLGAAGILVCKHQAAYLGPAALKASAGTLARLPVAQAANLSSALDTLAEAGFTIYAATHAPNAAPLFETALRLPAVLVLGNEDKGVRPGVLKHCPHTLAIPLARELDSLNVAQAGAICLAEFARRGKK